MIAHAEQQALFARIQENFADIAPQLIYSDWLEENNKEIESLLWRGAKTRSLTLFDFYGYGNGNGNGYGYGDGNGDGYGDGNGDGYSYGDGDGYGYSNGDGLIEKQNKFMIDNSKIIGGRPMIGKKMLVWAGRGMAWIGQVEEMYAPGAYKLSNGGMLVRTGGDSWMHVANGSARSRYVYRHAPNGIVYTGGEIHGAIEWEGDLPGKDIR